MIGNYLNQKFLCWLEWDFCQIFFSHICNKSNNIYISIEGCIISYIIFFCKARDIFQVFFCSHVLFEFLWAGMTFVQSQHLRIIQIQVFIQRALNNAMIANECIFRVIDGRVERVILVHVPHTSKFIFGFKANYIN
ncbi:hypothetical protein TTHERM_000586651 (macronuclear) [Tetrahymena thermophila SB210]|uniref:Uncharacterized protein n=1 Tax=Tetrahymena thermophila (strain SB210) TaxID=312017 RepID=W7XIM9_TETTS|nr:hypothetical protein TTHERM_000586651 [Tetrahymena thermophila SB210]EWS73439.1 hypothetical protein TTHERM_000586651 [Tetrahymena thermophila SB210]|eukprot:XP_012654010.1 hypothetical protein TTHERM_000586651 [Tetrahymena thermophila SB210]